MLLVGKNILNKKMISSEYEESPQHKVEDVLLHKKTFELEYLIYEEKKPEAPTDDHRLETSMDNVVNSTGGQVAMNTPPVTEDDTYHKNYTREILYIPFKNVQEINEDMVKVTGIDQQYHDPVDSIATESIIHKKVKTESGDTVGKIQDVVIDWETRRVVGLALSEGFWAKLVSEENRYMRLEENMDLTGEYITVPDHMKDHLVKEMHEVHPK